MRCSSRSARRSRRRGSPTRRWRQFERGLGDPPSRAATRIRSRTRCCARPPRSARPWLDDAAAAARSRKRGRSLASCPDPRNWRIGSPRSSARARRRGPHDEAALSDRELVILRMLTGHLSERDIGRELYLSHNTIHSHTRSIYRKLGVSSRSEALAPCARARPHLGRLRLRRRSAARARTGSARLLDRDERRGSPPCRGADAGGGQLVRPRYGRSAARVRPHVVDRRPRCLRHAVHLQAERPCPSGPAARPILDER